MTVELALVLLALGFVGAFVSGLAGVGGAVVMIPLLYYVPPLLRVGALDIRVVTGVTMVQVFVAAAVGPWTHSRHGVIHRRLMLIGGTAMAIGSLIGAIGSGYVSGRVLVGVFAVITTIALPLMFIPATRVAHGMPEASMPFSRGAAITCCGVIGLLSGLVGAGGAFLLIPALIAFLRMPIRVSIASSLAMVGMSAAAGVLGKALTAQIAIRPAAAVVLGSLVGAPWGPGSVTGRLSTC
jgi:hypothetical protein